MLAAAAAACAARAPRPTEPPPAPPPPPLQSDPSFDWRALVVAPFGSALKAIPVKVHEALLFKDDARGPAAGDDGECFAPDGAPPRFLGRTSDEYLMCFRQDRLSRIRASVHLDADQAALLFREACARWESGVAAEGTADLPPAPGPSARCAGRSGSTRYEAHLGMPADGSSGGAGTAADSSAGVAAGDDDAATVYMVIDGVPDP